MRLDRSQEWLEADGLGGFASGTVPGVRTRRYHALLLAASAPPSGRFVLVNGLEVEARRSGSTFPLSSQVYDPGVVHPDGQDRIVRFEREPWPLWELQLEDGVRVEHELFVPHGAPALVLRWRLAAPADGVTLHVRPLMSGRDPHSLHRENAAFGFEPEKTRNGDLLWRPYQGVPGILVTSNGTYRHAPEWYRSFLYEEERARGLDCVEDLASPGSFEWDLSAGEACLVLAATGDPLASFLERSPIGLDPEALRSSELGRRRAFATPVHRAADAYLVRRGDGKTIVAGYPWFGDWGRDTFIALRGLALATGRLGDAGSVLGAWTDAVSEGMLPNRFPDRGDVAEYNSVDASLWFVIAVHDYLESARAAGRPAPSSEQAPLRRAVEAILDGYARGTRYGIHVDRDGLLASGQPGVQLTWMDAKVGDRVVTPRTGKAVEVQALWLNALRAAGSWEPRHLDAYERGRRSFEERFWNPIDACLYDVVDVDHVPGRHDRAFRPNQIFAVGGLPWAVLEGERARRVVDEVERRLLTPLGLRSLAPGEPGYAPHYQGGVPERDGAYHQGTVWPWLLGPFVEAWVRVRGGTGAAKEQARRQFLDPLLLQLDEAGLGHVSEIADAEPPHTPRGCPFQAWSLGELIRVRERVLALRD